MKIGQFTIENTDETTWGNYFVRRILKVTSAKVTITFQSIIITITFYIRK